MLHHVTLWPTGRAAGALRREVPRVRPHAPRLSGCGPGPFSSVTIIHHIHVLMMTHIMLIVIVILSAGALSSPEGGGEVCFGCVFGLLVIYDFRLVIDFVS